VEVVEEPIDLTEDSDDWKAILELFKETGASLSDAISNFRNSFAGVDIKNLKGTITISKDLWGISQMSWTQSVYIEDDIRNKNRAFVDYSVTVSSNLDIFGGLSKSISAVQYDYGDVYGKDGKKYYGLTGATNEINTKAGKLSHEMLEAIDLFKNSSMGNIISNNDGSLTIKANISIDTSLEGLKPITVSTSTYKIYSGKAMAETTTSLSYELGDASYVSKSVVTNIRDTKNGRLIGTETINSTIINGTENIEGRIVRVYNRGEDGKISKTKPYYESYEEWIPGVSGQPGRFVEAGEVSKNILGAEIGEDISEIKSILSDMNDAISPFFEIALSSLDKLGTPRNDNVSIISPSVDATQVSGNVQKFFDDFFKATDEAKQELLKNKFGEALGNVLFSAYKAGEEIASAASQPRNDSFKGIVQKVIDWIKNLPGSVINCAIISLSGLLTKLGKNVSREELAQKAIIIDILSGALNDTTAKGAKLELSMYAIKLTAESKGVQLYGVSGSLDELMAAGPFIAHLDMNNDGTGDHFVIVTSITDRDVTYLDNGREVTVTKDKFSQMWQGKALTANLPKGKTELNDTEMKALRGAGTNYPDNWKFNLPPDLSKFTLDSRSTSTVKIYKDEVSGKIYVEKLKLVNGKYVRESLIEISEGKVKIWKFSYDSNGDLIAQVTIDYIAQGTVDDIFKKVKLDEGSIETQEMVFSGYTLQRKITRGDTATWTTKGMYITRDKDNNISSIKKTYTEYSLTKANDADIASGRYVLGDDGVTKYSKIKYTDYSKTTELTWTKVGDKFEVSNFKTKENWTDISDAWELEDLNDTPTPGATGDDTWVHKATVTTGNKVRDIAYTLNAEGNKLIVSKYINTNESWTDDKWTDKDGNTKRYRTPWSRSEVTVSYQNGTPQTMTNHREGFAYDDLHKDGFWTVSNKVSAWVVDAVDNSKGKWNDMPGLSYSYAATERDQNGNLIWFNYDPTAWSAADFYEYAAQIIGAESLKSLSLPDIKPGAIVDDIWNVFGGDLEKLGFKKEDFKDFATSNKSFKDYLAILIGKKIMIANGLNEDSFKNFGNTPGIMDILTEIIGKDNKEALTAIVLRALGFDKAGIPDVTSISPAFLTALSPEVRKEISNKIWDRLTAIHDVLRTNGIDIDKDNLIDKFIASGKNNLWDFFATFYHVDPITGSQVTGETLLKSRGITSESLNSIFIGEVLHAYLKDKVSNNPALKTFGLTAVEFLAKLGLTPGSLGSWTGGNLFEFISKKASISGILSLYNPAVHGTLWDFLTKKEYLNINTALLTGALDKLTQQSVDPAYGRYYDLKGAAITPWQYLISTIGKGDENVLEQILVSMGIVDHDKFKEGLNNFANRAIITKWGGAESQLPAGLQFNFTAPGLWSSPGASIKDILGNISKILTEYLEAGTTEGKKAALDKYGLGSLAGVISTLDVTAIIDTLGKLGEDVINCAVNALYNLFGGRVEKTRLAEQAILIDILTGVLTPGEAEKAVGENGQNGQLFLSMNAIKASAKLNGINFEGHGGVNLTSLQGDKLNIIAYVKVNGSDTGNHFVVITKITNEEVTYIDNDGKSQTILIEDFNKMFTGDVLLPEKTGPPQGANFVKLNDADLEKKLGGLNSFGIAAGLNPSLSYSGITPSYLNNQIASITLQGGQVVQGSWLLTNVYDVEFIRNESGKITGQKTTTYENIPGFGLVKTGLEVSTFIWKDKQVGGIVTGSVIVSYEYMPGQDTAFLTGMRKTENMYDDKTKGRYTQITYYIYAGYVEYDSSNPFEIKDINNPASNPLVIPTARQEIFTRVGQPSDRQLPGYIGGKYQEIRVYDYMGEADMKTETSRQYTWTSYEDINNDRKQEKVTNTFTIEPSINQILYFERSWREIQNIDGMDRFAAFTKVYEAGISMLTSIKVSYKGEFKDADGVTRFGTITKIWEAGLENWSIKTDPTSTIYTYKAVEGNKLVAYTDTFIGNVFDTRQKTYYAKQNTLEGEKIVQVTENWIGKDLFESFSFTYWGKVTDSLEKGEKAVKITENYLKIDNDKPSITPNDTQYLESRYYAYHMKDDSGLVKLVLERFEGTKSELFRVSVELRSTIIHNDKVVQKTEFRDPNNEFTISTSLTWKEVKTVSISGKDQDFVFTITQTYAQDDLQLLLTEESTRRLTQDEVKSLNDTSIIGAVTITETKEAGFTTSIRLNYRIQGSPKEVKDDLAAKDKTLISVTKIWEAGLENWLLKSEPTSTVYTYKMVEGEGASKKLVTYTDTFIGGVFDTRTKTYYAEQVIVGTVSDRPLQNKKIVQVAENWIGKDFLDSFSFTYWGKVTDSLQSGEKAVKITENYLDLNRNNEIDNKPEDKNSDTSVIESRYYAYYVTGGKLVLERFEGARDSLFRISVEERSTVIHNGKAAQKTEYKDPEGKITISTTYTWKEVNKANINGAETNLVFTITETYSQDQDLVLTREVSRRMLASEADYPKDAIGAV
ncbi:MAG: cysteine peptidase family C39 domain-containing protein, partial [Candidatus Desantisbacteria bacterium]